MTDLCIDARMAFCSGIGTYIREIVPFLKAAFRVILLVDQEGRDWCKDFEQIEFCKEIYSLKEQLQYPFKIPKCDLFWSPHYNVPLLAIKAKRRVATIHDACHFVFGSFLDKIYARLVMGKALQSDRAITVSNFSKREIEKRFGKKKLDVIPIGVNLDRFSREKVQVKVRQKYQLPKTFALFVGSQKPHKNLKTLQEAIAQIDDLELVAVGKDLLWVAEEDLPTLYSMAEVFVYPSLYEGFGLPPLEAMACGCPTVVSSVASIPEVCGEASLYFEPQNAEEMALSIQMARKKRDVLIESGLQRVKQFNWEKTAERHVQVFEEALNA